MQVYDYENGDFGEFETMLVRIITHDNDENVNKGSHPLRKVQFFLTLFEIML